MKDVIIVGDILAKKLSQLLKVKYIPIRERIFPDGELQPRLLKEESSKISVLILRKKRSETINDYLVKFFLIARKLKEISKKIVGIMPYLPYARQEKIFRPGEPLSAKYIIELIEKNLDIFVTVNAHFHRKKFKKFFTIPAFNLSVFKLLAKEFKKLKLKNRLIIGPDEGAKEYVKEFVNFLPSQWLILEKKRDVATGEINFTPKKLDLKNKNLIIVDDMVSTGGTVIWVIKMAKKFGAKTISLAFVHGVLVNNSIKKLKAKKLFKIISTNTIENPFEEVDILPEISKFLKNKIL